MADINLRSDDLVQMARKLESWIQDMNNLNLRIRNNVRDIEGWRDEQFNVFKPAITMTSSQLQGYCESMLKLSQVLEKLADEQDKASSTFNSQLGKYK